MIKRIKDLLSNFSNQEEDVEDQKISSLDKACSALLIEVAYADKIFDESEIISLKESLKETYDIDDIIICLLYTSPSPRDRQKARMPSSA